MQKKSQKQKQNIKLKSKKQARQNFSNQRRGRGRGELGMRAPKTQRAVAAAYSTGQSSYAPLISASNSSSRIVHRELIGSVVGAVEFTIQAQYALNPGLSSTFPWLSTQAVGWEQYHFNKLRFCYYTRTGSNIPGSVLLIPDYDAADSAPDSEQIASTYEDTEEDAPWMDIECILNPLAMHPDGPKKYIRSAALAANLDIKTYDAGNLFLATTDGTAVGWGKLWVEYDVTLYVPQLPPAGAAGDFQNYAGIPTTADIVGASPTLNQSRSLYTLSGSVLTFLVAGFYYVNYYATVSTSDTVSVNVTPGSGTLTLNDLNGDSRDIFGGGDADLHQQGIFSIPVGGTLTFDNVVVSGTGAELTVVRVPVNFS
jgi:hypothetical protein